MELWEHFRLAKWLALETGLDEAHATARTLKLALLRAIWRDDGGGAGRERPAPIGQIGNRAKLIDTLVTGTAILPHLAPAGQLTTDQIDGGDHG